VGPRVTAAPVKRYWTNITFGGIRWNGQAQGGLCDFAHTLAWPEQGPLSGSSSSEGLRGGPHALSICLRFSDTAYHATATQLTSRAAPEMSRSVISTVPSVCRVAKMQKGAISDDLFLLIRSRRALANKVDAKNQAQSTRQNALGTSVGQ
jgi:hypothetical protein